jgi:predicted PurR-regulated permease PerM
MNAESKPIRLSPTAKFITIAVIIVLTIMMLRAATHILAPFIGAIITAYLFNPLISFLHRKTNFGRAAWILVLYVTVGVVFYWLGSFLIPLAVGQYNDLRLRLIPTITTEIHNWVTTNHSIEIFGFMIDLGEFEQPILDFVKGLTFSLPEKLPHLVYTAFESLVLFVIYLIVAFYLLLQSEQIIAKFYDLIPAPYREEIRWLTQRIDRILGGYVRGTLMLIPIMSVLTYIALTILGVRYALVIAILSGFLEVIPVVGPWSAAGIGMSVALFQSTAPFGWPNWLLAAVVGITYFVLRMFEDSVIIPQVVGHAVHLHPVLVLFAVLAGGAIAGPFGLLIGIPTAAIAQLLLRYFYRKLIDSTELPPDDFHPPAKKTRKLEVRIKKPIQKQKETKTRADDTKLIPQD